MNALGNSINPTKMTTTEHEQKLIDFPIFFYWIFVWDNGKQMIEKNKYEILHHRPDIR